MTIVVTIDGRKAIPVRALPWITRWHFGIDDAVLAISHRTDDPAFAAVEAYRLRTDGRVARVMPPEWDDVMRMLEDVEERGLPWREWRVEATRCLPAGAFVDAWEWQVAYELCADGPKKLKRLLDGEAHAEPEDYADLQARTLDFDPMIPAELRPIVFEGFEATAEPTSFARSLSSAPTAVIPAPANAASPCAATPPTSPPCTVVEHGPERAHQQTSRHRIAGRRDVLAEPIKKAIAAAGSRDTAAVWLRLRDLALAEEAPFTGFTLEDGRLEYADARNQKQGFAMDALRKRLTPSARGLKGTR